MEHSESIKEIATALCKAQGEFEPIKKSNTASIPTKSGGGFDYQYAGLDSVIESIRPHLKKHDLSFTQGVSTSDGGVEITTMLLHNSGEWFSTSMHLKADTSGQKNALQSLGSSVTYARRYSLEGLLGIATTKDDDGNAGGASGKNGNGTPKTQRAPSNMIMTATEVPGEFWKIWKSDKDAARKLLGGKGYGYKKNETNKRWYITKGNGMPDPKCPTTSQQASAPPQTEQAPPPQAPQSDPQAQPRSSAPATTKSGATMTKPKPESLAKYNEIMGLCYRAKTKEDADSIRAMAQQAAASNMLDAEQGTRIEKTLNMILKARLENPNAK